MNGWQLFGAFILVIIGLVGFQIVRNRRGSRVFQSLANSIGAVYVPGYAWDAGAIRINHRGATLELDTHTTSTPGNETSYTRINVVFKSDVPVDFYLFPRNLTSSILVTGLTRIPFPITGRGHAILDPMRETLKEEISTGNEAFDRGFTICGAIPESLLRLFVAPATQSWLRTARISQYGGRHANGVVQLYLVARGEVFDRARLEAMVELVKASIDALLAAQLNT